MIDFWTDILPGKVAKAELRLAFQLEAWAEEEKLLIAARAAAAHKQIDRMARRAEMRVRLWPHVDMAETFVSAEEAIAGFREAGEYAARATKIFQELDAALGDDGAVCW